MAQADLLLPQWASLASDRQKFILQQLTRYFLSPLLSVDALVPVSVDYFGQTLNTFDTLIGGQWLRFVPGAMQVPLGVDRDDAATKTLLAQLPEAELSPKRYVDIPPMLVARQAIPVNEQVIGQVNLLTQVFRGNHFAYVPYKPTVMTLLNRHAQSLDPNAQSWPPILESGHVRLIQQSPHHYQVRLVHDWDAQALTKALGGFGQTLPNEDQYEYLQGGGLAQVFPWGNQLVDELPPYLPNRFGLTVKTNDASPELLLVGPDKRGEGLLQWSPAYRSLHDAPFAQHTYRPVTLITVD
ncbi:hypothetical protein [Lacticaseibacillus porcinae]|uniref:hypothetical protein n=1 Tax=Lacticaseibacillus porcinae TaxID=1123687 RepID=UPI000F7681D3|nr:hypothetical protein [Lacticaseibacillus porcinae]